LATTSGQFVIDSATVAAWSLTSPSSSRPAKVKFLAQAPGFGRTCVDNVASMASDSIAARGSHEARHAREARGLVLGAAPAGRLEPLVRDRERPEASFFSVRRDLVQARELRLGLFLLRVQGNLASTYHALGRLEEAVSMRRDVYSGTLNLLGAENVQTLHEAHNLAQLLVSLGRYETAKTYLRSMMRVARRDLGESHDLTLRMRWSYAKALCLESLGSVDTGATLDGLREAVSTLEEIERTARRVMGGAHPIAVEIGKSLRTARAALRARETPPDTR
jgi:tetratricopeptide (TPR) repeat protein